MRYSLTDGDSERAIIIHATNTRRGVFVSSIDRSIRLFVCLFVPLCIRTGVLLWVIVIISLID